MTADQIVGSCHLAWTAALGTEMDPLVPAAKDFDAWEDVFQEAWTRTVQRATELIEEAEGTRWSSLAANVQLEFARQLTEYPTPFEQLSNRVQLAWEAMVRHLANLLGGFDPAEDGELETHEGHWGAWVTERLARLARPEAETAALKEGADG